MWSWCRTLRIGPHTVFAKAAPLTDLECEHAYSTRNLFRIPNYYGIGSAGFGAFRELAARVKTTDWVCGGDFAGFPLMSERKHTRYPHRELEQRLRRTGVI